MPPSKFELNPAHIMQDIYSYSFPEVRQLINGLNLPQEFMLNTLPRDAAAQHLAPYGFQPPLDLPANADGSLRLDDLHEPVIDRIRSRVGATIRGLNLYGNAYPIPGSNQATFSLLAEWRAIGKITSIAVLEGEYEGYAANAATLRIPTYKYQSLDEAKPQDGQVWFISNPSAITGDWLDDEQWNVFTQSGHQIVYDAAYVGLTAQRTVDVSSENIQAILTSPSKIFGVFRNRYTGVTYTRESVASMYSTKWFKSIPSLLDTLKLYEEFGADELPKKYRPVQEEICRQLGIVVSAEVLPSDTLLIGHTSEQLPDKFKYLARANSYRFGLAKLFEDYE